MCQDHWKAHQETSLGRRVGKTQDDIAEAEKNASWNQGPIRLSKQKSAAGSSKMEESKTYYDVYIAYPSVKDQTKLSGLWRSHGQSRRSALCGWP
jgi:hypothetical protein